MESGIVVLTQKGREALTETQQSLSPLCRNILIQVDGKKSVEDVMRMFRGLKGLEEALQKLFIGNYISTSRECKDLVKAMTQQLLGPKAPTMLKKIDELHAKYGETCWNHLDELEKTARMFYGEVVADDLKREIANILRETQKSA